MLGTIDRQQLVILLRAWAAGSAAQVLSVADELATRGLSYSGALADLAVLLSRVAIQQRIPGTIAADDPLADDIAQLATVLHPDQTQLFYSVAVHSRSEEHTSELQSLMRISYAVFCLKNNNNPTYH